MRAIVLKSLASGILAVSCKSREYHGNVSQKTENGVTAPPFNAYQLWLTGKGAPILNYPEGYEDSNKLDGIPKPDGVFLVDHDTYYRGENSDFFGTTTEGATVEGDVLTYPTKEGRKLSLKFSQKAEGNYDHSQAVKYCKDKGLRLPLVQEIFDFCAAGNKGSTNDGDKSKRCDKNALWSASLFALYSKPAINRAWLYDGEDGKVSGSARYGFMRVSMRCVGMP
jgi:hypothetical protein